MITSSTKSANKGLKESACLGLFSPLSALLALEVIIKNEQTRHTLSVAFIIQTEDNSVYQIRAAAIKLAKQCTRDKKQLQMFFFCTPVLQSLLGMSDKTNCTEVRELSNHDLNALRVLSSHIWRNLCTCHCSSSHFCLSRDIAFCLANFFLFFFCFY